MRQPRKCQHIAQTTMHEPKADAGKNETAIAAVHNLFS